MSTNAILTRSRIESALENRIKNQEFSIETKRALIQ